MRLIVRKEGGQVGRFFQYIFRSREDSWKKPMKPYDWWNYSAPVYPPTHVLEEMRRTGMPVDWENRFWGGEKKFLLFKKEYAIFYRTRPARADEDKEDDEDYFITHVLPGSYHPAKGWLRRISNKDRL